MLDIKSFTLMDQIIYQDVVMQKLVMNTGTFLLSNGLTPNTEQLLLGTEGGNILMLDIKSFTLMDQIIYQDVVMQK